jgi:hypothetical protein
MTFAAQFGIMDFWFKSLAFGLLLLNLKPHLRITTQECFQDPLLQGLPG